MKNDFHKSALQQRLTHDDVKKDRRYMNSELHRMIRIGYDFSSPKLQLLLLHLIFFSTLENFSRLRNYLNTDIYVLLI